MPSVHPPSSEKMCTTAPVDGGHHVWVEHDAVYELLAAEERPPREGVYEREGLRRAPVRVLGPVSKQRRARRDLSQKRRRKNVRAE